MRGIIGHLFAQSELPIAEAIQAFKEAVAKTSPDFVKIPDMDPELHRRASELAQQRADALLADLGSLLAPTQRNRV